MGNISRGEIQITGVPNDWTREQKIELLNNIEATGKAYKGSYEGTLKALEPEAPLETYVPPEGPETTAGGMLGGMARELGPLAAAAGTGAALGSVVPGLGTAAGAGLGMAAYGITEAATPMITKFLNDKFGTTQVDARTGWEAIFDAMGVERPDTKAEQLVASGARGAAEAAKMVGGGMALAGTGPAALAGPGTRLQQIGQVVAESPAKQVVGGALAGAGAEAGAQIAESQDMGPVGSVLLPLGFGIAGDVAGAGLVDAARKVNNLLVARGMDLPDAAAEAIRLSQGRGELFLSDIDPQTTGAESFRSFRETVPGGTRDLRFTRNLKRKQQVYDAMDDFGVVEGEYYNQDIVDDFIKTRGDLVGKWTGEKMEVIDRLAQGETTVPIPKTLEFIDAKRAELVALEDESLQPIIRTLTNWEGALNNKDLAQVEFLRKRLRNQFEDPNLAAVKDDGRTIAREVYNSLNQEMGEYIQREGVEGDFAQWKTANAALKDMMGDFEVGAIERLIKKGEATPGLITNFLQSNDRATIENLYDGLSPQGRKAAQSSIMADMAKSATDLGELSPNEFARQLENNEARKVFFQGTDGQQLDGLQKWLENTRRDEFTLQGGIRPGSQLAGGQYALARGIWADPRIGLPVALAGKAGMGNFAKWVEQGDVRDLLIKYAAIPDERMATYGQELGKRLSEQYRAYMGAQLPRKEGEE